MIEIKNLKPSEFMSAFHDEAGAVLLDVRRPEEVAEGMIPGAININFQGDSFHQDVEKLDRKTPYYIYCRSGGRSMNSCLIMKELGFESLTNMDGGYLAYKS